MRSEFKIFNDFVYGLEHSLFASAYPMDLEIPEMTLEDKAMVSDFKRGVKLGNAKQGSGHDCYLKGIVVQMDITAPQYWWLQFGRYDYQDIVSSQSKMHRITQMDINTQCNQYVHQDMVEILKIMIVDYNNEATKKKFQQITSSTPMGLMLTARVVTNYLQLKTMWYQRKGHKLEEWKQFRDWSENLPYFTELCLNK